MMQFFSTRDHVEYVINGNMRGFLEVCIASCMSSFWHNLNEVLFLLFWGRDFLFWWMTTTLLWGFLSMVMRNVSDTWQLLGITKASKQKALSRIVDLSLLLHGTNVMQCKRQRGSVCRLAWLPLQLLEKQFILLFFSAGDISVYCTLVSIF